MRSKDESSTTKINKMAGIRAYLSLITLNVNGLNS
jgi:hypothetical protein